MNAHKNSILPGKVASHNSSPNLECYGDDKSVYVVYFNSKIYIQVSQTREDLLNFQIQLRWAFFKRIQKAWEIGSLQQFPTDVFCQINKAIRYELFMCFVSFVIE